MQTARCFEIYTAEGNLICRVYFTERPVPGEGKTDGAVKQPSKAEEKKNGSEGEAMTSAQRRFLFRILAGQGLEGDKAHEELKKLFRVPSLQDVTKLEASGVIDRLVREGKGGNGHGSSL